MAKIKDSWSECQYYRVCGRGTITFDWADNAERLAEFQATVFWITLNPGRAIRTSRGWHYSNALAVNVVIDPTNRTHRITMTILS